MWMCSACNILVQDVGALYKLENFGREINCSLTTLFDAKIRVLSMSTGVHGSQVKYPASSSRSRSSGIYHKVLLAKNKSTNDLKKSHVLSLSLSFI